MFTKMKSIKTIIGALLLILTAQVAMAQKKADKLPADSIRYFLLNASIKPPPKPVNISSLHSGYRDTSAPFCLDLQSTEARVYSPGNAKVFSVFEIEGNYAIMLQIDSASWIIVSDVTSTGLKKDEWVKRGTYIGEAPWNEDTNKFECSILLLKKGKGWKTREMLDKCLDDMK